MALSRLLHSAGLDGIHHGNPAMQLFRTRQAEDGRSRLIAAQRLAAADAAATIATQKAFP
jgi:hypothetical protein